jgi:hypothetical protein
MADATTGTPNETAIPTVDIAAINAEIAKLPQSALVEELTKLRVRQKVQQKKQQGKGSQKAYQLKQRAKANAMKELALKAPATMVDPSTNKPYANLWEQINAQAEVQADKAFEDAVAVPEDDEAEQAATA